MKDTKMLEEKIHKLEEENNARVQKVQEYNDNIQKLREQENEIRQAIAQEKEVHDFTRGKIESLRELVGTDEEAK
jgi:uncharacterized coiled-coil DUF342 family protein